MIRDIDEKIAIIKKRLENRSKECIINDICNYIDENNVEEIAWMFDIELQSQKTNRNYDYVSEVMEVCNIKELPPFYKDQLGDRLSYYKLIGVFDMIKRQPLKIYIHFMDFRIQQIKNIVENPKVGHPSIYYLISSRRFGI